MIGIVLAGVISSVPLPWRIWGLVPSLLFIWIVGLIQIQWASDEHEAAERLRAVSPRRAAYRAGTITRRSRPDSAPHASPERPSIWRTLAPSRFEGKLSNFSVSGSKRTAIT